jgi:predicted MFS family arabinose efflux permease
MERSGRHGVHFAHRDVGFALGVSGATTIATQLVLGQLLRWLGDVRVGTLGLVIVVSTWATMPLVHSFVAITVAISVMATGNVLSRASLMGRISRAAAPHEQGVVLGFAQSMRFGCALLGALYGMVMFGRGAAVLWPVLAVLSAGVALVLDTRANYLARTNEDARQEMNAR